MVVSLDGLRLIHHIIELLLLKLKVLLFKCCLLGCLSGWLSWLCLWAGQDKTLVDVCNVVIVQVLCVVLFNMRTCLLLVRKPTHKTHALWHILALIK